MTTKKEMAMEGENWERCHACRIEYDPDNIDCECRKCLSNPYGVSMDGTKCLGDYFKPRPEVEKPEGCPAFDDYGNPILITMTGGKKP